MADLNWKVTEISFCNGTPITVKNDTLKYGWIEFNKISGVGEGGISFSADPATNISDCDTALINISAVTGEEKQITVTRCLPECNCDAITYTANNSVVMPSGGTSTPVSLGTGTLKYGCTSVGVVGNFDASVSINGSSFTVYANNIPKSDNTVSQNQFNYYLTCEGVNCSVSSPSKKGNFVQQQAADPCADASITPAPYVICPTGTLAWNDTEIDIRFSNFSDCWEVTIGNYGDFEAILSNVVDTTTYTGATVTFTENKGNDRRTIGVTYIFTNIVTNQKYTYDCSIKQDPYISNCTCETYITTVPSQITVPSTGKTRVLVASVKKCIDNTIPMSYTATSLSVQGCDDCAVPTNCSNCASVPTVFQSGDNFYADFYENKDLNEREITFLITYDVDVNGEVCTIEDTFYIRQAGTEPEECKVFVSTFSTGCSNNAPTISFYTKKSSSTCPTQSITVDLYTGDTMVVRKALIVDTYIYKVNKYSPTYSDRTPIGPGNYTIKWANTQDASNSGETAITVGDCSVPKPKDINVVFTLVVLDTRKPRTYATNTCLQNFYIAYQDEQLNEYVYDTEYYDDYKSCCEFVDCLPFNAKVGDYFSEPSLANEPIQDYCSCTNYGRTGEATLCSSQDVSGWVAFATRRRMKITINSNNENGIDGLAFGFKRLQDSTAAEATRIDLSGCIMYFVGNGTWSCEGRDKNGSTITCGSDEDCSKYIVAMQTITRNERVDGDNIYWEITLPISIGKPSRSRKLDDEEEEEGDIESSDEENNETDNTESR